MKNLERYFEKKYQELVSQFETSSLQKSSDNLGFNRERFINIFLKEVLPKRLSIVQGEMFGLTEGDESCEISRSGQLDTIVIRDDCPILDFGGRNSYLFGGVFSVIEIKSSLKCSLNSETGDLQGSLAQALKTFKGIPSYVRPPTQGVIGADVSNIPEPLKVIVAYDGLSVDAINQEKYRKFWYNTVDMICVLKSGVLIGSGLQTKFESSFDISPGVNVINSKAASLGLLYYFIAQYGTTFVLGNCDLQDFFCNLDEWK